MKRVLTTGKITTDPETGQRVLWQYFNLDGRREATPARCLPGNTGRMLRVSAYRALISQRLRKQA
jgi:hypothetical protein